MISMVCGVLLGIALPSAAATPAMGHIRNGGIWTMQFSNGRCEVQTFEKHRTWTSDAGDSGTYTGGAKHLTELFDNGGVFGTFFKSHPGRAHYYDGSYTRGSLEYGAQLILGEELSC